MSKRNILLVVFGLACVGLLGGCGVKSRPARHDHGYSSYNVYYTDPPARHYAPPPKEERREARPKAAPARQENKPEVGKHQPKPGGKQMADRKPDRNERPKGEVRGERPTRNDKPERVNRPERNDKRESAVRPERNERRQESARGEQRPAKRFEAGRKS